MKIFPNGLSDRMMRLAPNADGAAALVQRTLAQHGLAAPGVSKTTHTPRPSTPVTARLPDGALFHSGTHTGTTGARDYWLYTPASAKGSPSALVVMLHGCTQTPQDFAAGTAMNDHAERHGFAVLYPAQSRGANAQSCWNWFSKADQRRNRGEPAILAGMTAQVTTDLAIPKTHVFVAGLSAGGAMAVILAETYPDVFAAVGVHSGLPFGAASDVGSAFAAMAGQTVGGGLAPTTGRCTPTIVFHGTADATVHPSNGERIASDALAVGGPQVQTVNTGRAPKGHAFTRAITTTDAGHTVEHWAIEGMGHAWSGGHATGTYTDALGPDASAEMVRFFLHCADPSQPV